MTYDKLVAPTTESPGPQDHLQSKVNQNSFIPLMQERGEGTEPVVTHEAASPESHLLSPMQEEPEYLSPAGDDISKVAAIGTRKGCPPLPMEN